MIRALLLSLLTTSVFAAPPEVRGTWLTTTGNDNMSTPQNTRHTMRDLRSLGLNAVYVECWKDGHVAYPSKLAEFKIIGNHVVQRDLLQEAIIEAHRNQMLCFAWFEYGFMAAHGTDQNALTAHQDWLLRDQNGNEIAKDGFVWLNPVHPEVQQLILKLAREAASKYDLDGIQFDDHLAWPSPEMGYDDYTQNAYAADHKGQRPPKDIHDVEWGRWRIQKISDFALQLTRAIHETNPKMLTSYSPGPYPWCLHSNFCDWVTWPEWDEMLPQIYRKNYAEFTAGWADQPFFHADAIAGIGLTTGSAILPPGDATKAVQLEHNTHGGGQVWWFSQQVLSSHRNEIAAIYNVAKNGPAPHLQRDENWRPAPIVAKYDGQHWTAQVPREGNYLEIHLLKGQWKTLGAKHFGAGNVSINDSNAKAVELLIDHRNGQ